MTSTGRGQSPPNDSDLPPEKPWSLQRRMTIWFACTTSLLVLVMAVLSTWAVFRSTEHALEALATEELEEAGTLFSVSGGTPAEFVTIAQELAHEHPQTALAWRVWSLETGEPWGEFGQLSLFQRADPPLLLTSEGLVAYDDSLRWGTDRLTDGLAVGVLFDASETLGMARTFTSMAIAFVPISGLVATLAGALLGRRVSRLMRRIAAGLRDIRDPSAEVTVDVTGAPDEVRLVADALREMLENIREESESARLITSGLAHELRSPIQNLLSETDVVLLKTRDSAEYQHVLESHREELRELARAIDNLVTLCAAGERVRPVGGEFFDLGREAGFRLERERALAQRKGVSFDLDCVGALDYQGDREAILLAIGNVVTNAIQWTDSGGGVAVRIEGDDRSLEIVIDDDGPGIPAEKREEIFKPFRRGGTIPGRRQGYGLGLALAGRAVRDHGGEIEVEDAPGGGARLRISLPKQRPSPVALRN